MGHSALLLACLGSLLFGLSRLRPGQAETLGARDALLSFDSAAGRGPFRWLYLAAAVLVMKALVPLSNVLEFAAGFGGPGLIRIVVGEERDRIVLPILVCLTVGAGLAAAGAVARRVAVRYVER